MVAQAEEIAAAPSFQVGDLSAGLVEAFLSLDRRMEDPASREELAQHATSTQAPR